MSPEDRNEILADPEVVAARNQVYEAGLPLKQLTDWALAEATKNMNPGTQIAAKLVADCLMQKVREHEEKRHPTKLWGKIKKFIFTGKWG